jgi:hypothetical protein
LLKNKHPDISGYSIDHVSGFAFRIAGKTDMTINSLLLQPQFNDLTWNHMVEPGGLEPPTSCVQGRRSPS